jgi:hypothetical protein
VSQCTEQTAHGRQCRNQSIEGTDRCQIHTFGMPAGAVKPTIWNEDVQARLIASLRSGNYLHIAAKAAGISLDTFRTWMVRGKEGEEPWATLKVEVEKARAEGQVRNVAIIARAAETDWRAAVWLLERSAPELWGAVSVRVRSDAEPPPDQEVLEAEVDPFAEFDELAERRAARAG